MDLLRQENLFFNFYADDLVIICNSEGETIRTIDLVNKWASMSNMLPNFKKSAIVVHNLKRLPTLSTKASLPIPLCSSYKYLGA